MIMFSTRIPMFGEVGTYHTCFWFTIPNFLLDEYTFGKAIESLKTKIHYPLLLLLESIKISPSAERCTKASGC